MIFKFPKVTVHKEEPPKPLQRTLKNVMVGETFMTHIGHVFQKLSDEGLCVCLVVHQQATGPRRIRFHSYDIPLDARAYPVEVEIGITYRKI